MRFSMRWLMAGMAYIALLAAAVGTRALVFMDLVWCVTLLAICYATVVAIIDRGKRQAMAIGFVALSSIYILGSYVHPESTPAMWLYHAAGYSVDTGVVYEQSPVWEANLYNVPRYRRVSNYVPNPRVAHGVAALLAGIIGCGVGALAFRGKKDGG